ncbi:DUF2878 domain-containing protein [Pseudomonas putida]|uniref:DUF2878 domain-containing protein n=1 Tax=Pseudomonas putida TaxID=303 RepID=A0A1Q9QYM6_PSEPU|nr:DUF2878 domain-containing protein [Pseudomonas putida]OLS60253.1 hypothetical protein PSEMO_46640 [Pseudomonas putida]
MSRRAWLVGNALWLQAGWWGCVLGARHSWLLWAVGVGLVVHLRFCPDWRAEVRVVLGVGLAGCVLDSLLCVFGVFDFAPLPIWLALLWLVLASGLRHSLGWMRTPIWLGVVGGMIGGPLAYLAGARLAGVGLPLGNLGTVLVLAPLWALWFPICLRWAQPRAH